MVSPINLILVCMLDLKKKMLLIDIVNTLYYFPFVLKLTSPCLSVHLITIFLPDFNSSENFQLCVLEENIKICVWRAVMW